MSLAEDLPEHAGPRMPAVRNCIALLRALGRTTSPVSAGALARSLGVPRSSTYQLLQVLISEGLVIRVPGAAGYTLGDGVVELGSAYSRRSSLENLAQPLLDRLVRAVGESATLSILRGHDLVYLSRAQPQRPVPLVSEPGVHLPAHLTASGRAILAQLPRREVLAWFAQPDSFTTRNGQGPTTLRELRSVLAEDRARGWSIEVGTVTDGITCISAAAYDRTGRPVAAVTTSFQARRGERPIDQIAGEVVRAAAELTKRLGGTATTEPHSVQEAGRPGRT